MIKTERLTIKSYDKKDQDDMINILTNDIVKKTFVIPDFKSHQEAVHMFNKLMNYSYSDEHYEKGIYKDGVLIGFVNDVEIDKDTIEIGYVIHPDHHNKGYATEALTAVIDDLFKKGFRSITAAAFENNIASRRVMEKCGMKLTDKTSIMIHNGILQNCLYYSIYCKSSD
ncbi:MAG TPA: GNAT family N-acetyltransferase [Clostridia bacterium]|nr:GNAT family N-acetyltransferase [Clostridia bacterium]